MSEPTSVPATVDQAEADQEALTGSGAEQQDLVVEDLLVEEVSIDGMCGVY